MSDLPLIIAAAAEGEEEGGSFLVSPDIGLMIWTLLVFGISMYVLAKLAFPRIAEALDRRQRAIEESIDTAERTRSEAEQLLAEYRERLQEARVQAEEEGGGSFLVTPDVGLMIWTLLVFGISMYLLYKLAFPRITEALDRRQRAIEDSIDTAERTRKEADELLAEYRERLTAARWTRSARRWRT